MNKYEQKKEEARECARNWQLCAETPLSLDELGAAGDRLEKLAKRYGLIKEFKENGII